MRSKLSWTLILILIIASFAIGVYFYPTLPDMVASHWNSRGEVDGHMDKLWGTFLMPLILLLIAIIFWVIPKIDPLRRNIDSFKKHYNLFAFLFSLFLFYIFILTIIWNTGTQFNMSNAILPIIGLLFVYVGYFFKYAKRNWFIGIRTPWTLSSDYVWEKTHILGSSLFRISGLIAVLGLFFPKYSIWMVIVPVLVSTVTVIIYSYFIHKKVSHTDHDHNGGPL